MACVECEERRKRLRDAIMHGRMAEALDTTVEGLRVMIGIDAGADHRKAMPVLTPALPSLTKKTKVELVDIAGAEGVVLPEDATNEDIVKLIETKRRQAA